MTYTNSVRSGSSRVTPLDVSAQSNRCCLAELVLRGDLRGAHRTFHVLLTIDAGIEALVLEEAEFAPRLVVGGAAVGVVEHQARMAGDQGAEVREAAPHHARGSRLALEAILLDRASRFVAAIRQRAHLAAAQVSRLRERAGEQVPDALAEDRVVAAHGERRRAVRRRGGGGRRPGVAELVDEEVLVAPASRLMPCRFPSERMHRGQVALGADVADPLAAGGERRRGRRCRSRPRCSRPSWTRLYCRIAGNSRVLISTCAPLKSPCWSGVKVLEVVIVSRRPDGNRSSGTVRFSGSGLGTRVPLSGVVV